MLEPNYTCGDIDSVKDKFIDLSRGLEEISSILSDIGLGKYCDLETLRKANIELREYGNYWKNEYSNIESELAEVNEKYELERDKNRDLEARVRELEQEVWNLNDQFSA